MAEIKKMLFKLLFPMGINYVPSVNVSEIAFTFLNLNHKILPPQHIVVNPFPDYPFQKNSTCISLASHIPPAICKTGKCNLGFL
jgi:hypothetical protein